MRRVSTASDVIAGDEVCDVELMGFELQRSTTKNCLVARNGSPRLCGSVRRG